MKTTKNSELCQCCGIQINKDPENGGTNLDVTQNAKYCTYCYPDGEFLFKATVEEMQAFCIDKMIEQGS